MTEQNGVGRSSATDELRRMLDERGVEWKEHKHAMSGSMAIQRETLWGQPTDVASGKSIPHVYHYRATEMVDGRLFLEAQLIAPEQAIAATLGSEDTYTREDVESAFVSGYSLGSLPVGSDPRWDENRQTVDEHMAEFGWVRISDAEDSSTDTNGHDSGHVRNVSTTLGRGECHDTGESRVFHCSECGFGIEDAYVEDEHAYPPECFPRFCPWCGAKVVRK